MVLLRTSSDRIVAGNASLTGVPSTLKMWTRAFLGLILATCRKRSYVKPDMTGEGARCTPALLHEEVSRKRVSQTFAITTLPICGSTGAALSGPAFSRRTSTIWAAALWPAGAGDSATVPNTEAKMDVPAV